MSTVTPLPDETLRRFTGPDAGEAERAFDRLMRQTTPMLRSYLQWKIPVPDDREDVIQEVKQRLWRSRQRLEDRGMGGWWRYVKTTADRITIDYFRERSAAASLDDPEMGEIPDADLPDVDALVGVLVDRERLYRLADACWLGAPAPDHSRRLLAAKLFYVDGLPWSDVCEIVGRGSPDRRPPSRRELDDWLADQTVLAHLAYSSLYVSNDALTQRLLGLPAGDPESLERLARRAAEIAARDAEPDEAPPTENWTWPEIAAILWRFRHAMLLDQIVRLQACRLDLNELEQLFDRCRDLFPFSTTVVRLKESTKASPGAGDVLSGAKLWQRLVFQYFAADTLPHRDIHDRTAPAAEAVGYQLTLGMLNVWLSNGRLMKSLAKFAGREEQA